MTAPAVDSPLFDHPDEVARLVARFEDAVRFAPAVRGGADLPLRHYPKALLMSAEARFGWVEPDLRPIA